VRGEQWFTSGCRSCPPLRHDFAHRSAHVPEVTQEHVIAPYREIGARQEQGSGISL
jgi:hypothetical protein